MSKELSIEECADMEPMNITKDIPGYSPMQLKTKEDNDYFFGSGANLPQAERNND